MPTIQAADNYATKIASPSARGTARPWTLRPPGKSRRPRVGAKRANTKTAPAEIARVVANKTSGRAASNPMIGTLSAALRDVYPLVNLGGFPKNRHLMVGNQVNL